MSLYAPHFTKPLRMASTIASTELKHTFEEFYKVNSEVWKLGVFIHTLDTDRLSINPAMSALTQ